MNTQEFEERKRAHIRHSLSSANQAEGLSGLSGVQLVHEALPDLDFDDLDIRTPCLGRGLATPFYIAGMTAGHPDARELNRKLAVAAQTRGWAMGIGSMRRELESGQAFDDWTSLRRAAPGLVLFGNIGITQLISSKTADLRRLVDSIEAQALVVHTNPLQESLQLGGTPRFRGAIQALELLCRELGVPVILKETGCGMSRPTLLRLAEIGLAAVDVSGAGGTHWGRIEGARAAEAASPEGELRARAAETFCDWGESTVTSVLAAREILPSRTELWASGGVRSGLDAAKLIALGADRVGYAKPALEAALQGEEQLQAWMKRQEFELQVALFCTGCRAPADLRKRDGVWTRRS